MRNNRTNNLPVTHNREPTPLYRHQHLFALPHARLAALSSVSTSLSTGRTQSGHLGHLGNGDRRNCDRAQFATPLQRVAPADSGCAFALVVAAWIESAESYDLFASIGALCQTVTCFWGVLERGTHGAGGDRRTLQL